MRLIFGVNDIELTSTINILTNISTYDTLYQKELIELRSAKECKEFPYTSKKVCYIEVFHDNSVKKVSPSLSEIEPAYNNLINDKSTLYAVWPGNFQSDLFVIDDPNLLADAYGIQYEGAHSHKIKWKLSSIDDGKSSYAYVSITFLCDCELSIRNIKAFAADMKRQYGWEVATTKGVSGHNKNYTISVRRNTLK